MFPRISKDSDLITTVEAIRALGLKEDIGYDFALTGCETINQEIVGACAVQEIPIMYVGETSAVHYYSTARTQALLDKHEQAR